MCDIDARRLSFLIVLVVSCLAVSLAQAASNECAPDKAQQDFSAVDEAEPGGKPPQEFRWKANPLQKRSASEQITSLYFALRNSGKLSTRWVRYDTRVQLSDFVSHSSFGVGTSTLGLDALLCDLNQNYCHRDITQVAAKEDDLLGHLSGTNITQPNWLFKAVQGTVICLQVPDIDVEVGKEIAKVSEVAPVVSPPQVHIVNDCQKFPFGQICVPRAEYTGPLVKQNDFVLGLFKSGGDDLAWIRTFTVNIKVPVTPYNSYRQAGSAFSTIFTGAGRYYDFGYYKLSLNIGEFISSLGTVKLESVMDASANSVLDMNATPYIYTARGKLLKWTVGGPSRTIISVIDAQAHIDHCGFDSTVLVDASDFISHRAKKQSVTKGTCNGAGVAPDEAEHGTHVLGMFTAVPANATANNLVRLPNYGVLYFPLNMLQMRTSLAYRDALAAWIKEAAYIGKVSVFNLSWSYIPEMPGNSKFRDPIKEAIEELKDRALFVVAAGQEGVDASPADDANRCAILPACYDGENVVSVVAVEQHDNNDVVPIQSNGVLETNVGARFFSVSAPGRNVISTVQTQNFSAMSGTSQAAPMVSAAAAQLFALRNFRPVEVKERIIATSELHASLLEISMGGIPNVPSALNSDKEFFQIASGCEQIVRSSKLVEPGHFTPQPVEVSDDGGNSLSIQWSSIKRLAVLKDGRYLIFYKNDGQRLDRATGLLSDATKQLLVRIKTDDSSVGCSDEQKRSVKMSDIIDYMSRL
ncbi:S8 family serine peptidase [Mesorhizobium sp. M0142]|uniref:S8 family serine peptidase n=1 Tax=unclassified Mesorhizobium TaxID=325217 RepID=UPI00333C58E5